MSDEKEIDTTPVSEPEIEMTTPEPVVEPLPNAEKVKSEPHVPTREQLVVAGLILAGVFAASYIPGIGREKGETSSNPLENRVRDAIERQEKEAIPTPEDIKIDAKAAFVWDVNEQRALYNKDADAQLPLASLTKLMTALVAYETLGNDARVPIHLDAILQDGESGFLDGETFTAADLSNYTLVSSSNDGAFALAASAGSALDRENGSSTTFVEAMNIRAEELGLLKTYYTNPTGLDTNVTESGSYGSARDMAFLMEYLIAHHPEILEGTTKENATLGAHTATNTNEALPIIPGLIGSKTGFTDLAGGNLLIAFDAGLNRPIIVSVLGSSREGRFKDVTTLVKYAQDLVTLEDQES